MKNWIVRGIESGLLIGAGLLLFWGLAPGLEELLAHFTVGQDAGREVTALQRYAGGWWKVWLSAVLLAAKRGE